MFPFSSLSYSPASSNARKFELESPNILRTFVANLINRPPQKYWQYPNIITDGSCLDEAVNTMSASILSCIGDLLCTALPVPVIWSLNMPLRERISVIVLLSGGMIVTVAGILRTYFTYTSLFGEERYDQSWSTYPLWICAAVEIYLAIVSQKMS